MKKITSIFFVASLLLVGFSAQAASTLTDPSSTDTAQLRTDCTDIADCAETLTELIPWIWNVRAPSASAPLTVKIGAGTFPALSYSSIGGGSFCNNAGYVSFIGSGKKNTIIESASGLSGIEIQNCDNLVFQDLTFDLRGAIYGIFWNGDGSSRYTNVQLLGGGAAWYDQGCSAEGSSVHYFMSSQIKATGNMFSPLTAYLSRCAQTWFIGSEIVAISKAGGANTITAESAGAIDPEIHIYGSSLRAESPSGRHITSGKRLVAVYAKGGADVHIHGTGIDVISQEANDIAALVAESGAHIHANQSAFVLETATGGTRTRLENNGGMIMAPYVWGDVSMTTGVTSLHGADISVSTDTADGQPHMLIYSDNCASNWFDSTVNACR